MVFHSSKTCQQWLVLTRVCRPLIVCEWLTFEIGSCTERSSSAGNDTNIERGLGIEPFPDYVELRMAILVDTIQVFGSVQSHEQDSGRWV
jgi:hypothetical protein